MIAIEPTQGKSIKKRSNKCLNYFKTRWRLILILSVSSVVGSLSNPPPPPFFNYDVQFPEESTTLDCTATTKTHFYLMRGKEHSGKAISVNLATIAIPESDKYIPDTDSQKRYGVYELGNSCLYHSDRAGKNANPLFILVIQNSAPSFVNGCKIVKIITNTGLQPCTSEPTEDILDVLQLKSESGAPATPQLFQKIIRNPNFDFKILRPVLYEFTEFSFSDFDSRVMEMLLLYTLSSKSQKQANIVSVLDYNELNGINTRKKWNSFSRKIEAAEVIKRITRDDLPGYLLSDYPGAINQQSKYAQVITQSFPHVSTTIHYTAYIASPSKMVINRLHDVSWYTKPFRANKEQKSTGIHEQVYRVKITRRSTSLTFKVMRGGNNIYTLHHEYLGGDKFIYFSLTIGRGVLYFTGPDTVRAKTYETFHIYEVGGTPQRAFRGVETTTTLPNIIYDSSNTTQPSFLWKQIRYSPPSEDNDQNIAGFRLLTLTVLRGAYPPYLITESKIRLKYPRCYFGSSGENHCIAMALLSDASESQATSYVSGTWSSVVEISKPKMEKICRAGYSRGSCLSPQPGYVINLEKSRSPIGVFGGISFEEFEGLSSDLKRFVHVFENNRGTKYMVSCPESCKD